MKTDLLQDKKCNQHTHLLQDKVYLLSFLADTGLKATQKYNPSDLIQENRLS